MGSIFACNPRVVVNFCGRYNLPSFLVLLGLLTYLLALITLFLFDNYSPQNGSGA
jgi:hypothetical protein